MFMRWKCASKPAKRAVVLLVFVQILDRYNYLHKHGTGTADKRFFLETAASALRTFHLSYDSFGKY